MSTSIDNRIVNMQFNNTDFNEKATKTIGLVDKLQESLLGIGKDVAVNALTNSLDNLSSNSLQYLSESVQMVSYKFSALEAMAVGALMRIGQQAYDTGSRFVKSLTIDQITDGFSKYEDKTTAVQTIMAATLTTWEAAAQKIGFTGTQMEYVNEQLDKLNWFTDETSYSFTDMVTNIGKFTSNNIALNDAVTAMQGISTWAAISGQTTESAGRAMYNLSQAISVGAVKLQDWKSIENANMATTEFKQTAIDTAVELGILKKTAENTYKTIAKTGTEVKGNQTVTLESFSQTLSNAWFNTEILMKTLDKYGNFANKLYDISDTYDVTATQFLSVFDKLKRDNPLISMSDAASDLGMSVEDLTEIMNELSSAEYDVGYRAFKAAQEAKTFKEAISATKDAVSTGWMTTFENIFGNYEEAKVRFTELANYLYDIFAEAGNRRNEILKQWKEWGGSEDLFGTEEVRGALWNLLDTVENVMELIGNAWNSVFGTIDGHSYSIDTMAIRVKKATGAFREFSEVLKAATSLKDISTDSAGATTYIDKFGNVLYQANVDAEKFGNTVRKIGDAYYLLNSQGQLVQKVVGDTLQLVEVAREGTEFTERTTSVAERLQRVFRGLVSVLGIVKKVAKGVWDASEPLRKLFVNIADGVLTASAELGDWLFNLEQSIEETDTFKSIMSLLGEAVEKCVGFIRDFKFAASNMATDGLEKLSDILNRLGNSFKNFDFATAMENLQKELQPVFDWLSGTVTSVLNKLKGCLGNVNFSTFIDMFKALSAIKLGSNIVGALSGLGSVGSSLKKFMADISSVANIADTSKIYAIAVTIAVIAGALVVLSDIPADKIAVAIGALNASLLAIKSFIKGFTDITSSIGKKNQSSNAMMLVEIAAAVYIMALAIEKLDGISLDNALAGLGVIEAFLLELASFAALIRSKEKVISGLGLLLISVAGAVWILTEAMKNMSDMDSDQIEQGTKAVSSMILMLSLFGEVITAIQKIGGGGEGGIAGAISKIGDSSQILAVAAGLIAMAVAVNMLVKPIKEFGKMNADELDQGMETVTVAITIMAGALMVLTNSKIGAAAPALAAAGAAIVMVAIALNLIAAALKGLSGESIDTIGPGFLALTLALAAIVVGLQQLSAVSAGAIVGAAAILVTAIALGVLASAINKLAETDPMALTAGVATLGIMLGVVTAALIGLSTVAAGAIVGAAAILVVAVSMKVFASALKTFERVNGLKVAGVMLVLAAGILAIGIVCTALEGAVPAVLSFAAAILAFGAGIALVGVGIALFGVGLYSLINAFNLLGSSLIQLVKNVGELAVALGTTIAQIIQAICIAIGESLTVIVETVITIITAVLDAIVANAQTFVEKVVAIVVSIIEGIANTIGDIIQAGVDLAIAFINGLADAIGSDDNRARVKEAAINLISAITGFSKDEVTAKIEELKEIGGNIINGIREGIEAAWEASKVRISSIFGGISTIARDVLKVKSPSRVMMEIGEYVSEGLAIGIAKKSDMATGAVEDMANSTISTMSDTISRINDAVNGELNDPVIRPVLDLSNVRSGASSLAGLIGGHSISLAGGVTVANAKDISGTGTTINIYPQSLSNAQIDYIYAKFNARMGAALS